MGWRFAGTMKHWRELLVDIEQQNAIKKERVSSSEGKPDIEGRQDYFRFEERVYNSLLR